MKVQITQEAYKLLYEHTPSIKGTYVSNDQREFTVDLSDEAYERLQSFARPREDISNVIIRLCKLNDLLFGE